MQANDPLDSVLSEAEAELAKAAQRCIMTALDHSRAHKIVLVDQKKKDAPVLELPPKVLRLMADLLNAMGQRQPITVMPQKHELTTQEAAAFLNVSRPFVVKQLEEGRIPFRKVGRHRRIEFENLVAYQRSMKEESDSALQELADQAQALNMGY
jgi:excisionase family DNA binding protein